MNWTTLRSINTKRFSVMLQWQPETDEDLSWMDNDDRARLARGEWTNCCFRVAVFLDRREIACEYLGNSVYEDPREFAREHFGINHFNGGCYFPQMLRSAIVEARKRVYRLPPLPQMRTRGIAL